MANNLKCEYLEGSEELLTPKDDAKSATNAGSQGEGTDLTALSDSTEVPIGRHDAATEQVITGDDLACARPDWQVPGERVGTEERPDSDVAK